MKPIGLKALAWFALIALTLCGFVTQGQAQTPSAQVSRIDGKQVLFVIYDRFEQTEYRVPRSILEERGAVVTVASSSSRAVTGHQGMRVQPDKTLSDVGAADYDAVVFIGGFGYEKNDPQAQRVAREAVAENKLLAAICIAPITLAKAGVVEGKRVTCTASAYSEVRKAGAARSNASVERDGLLITANGPDASRRFGETIAAALAE